MDRSDARHAGPAGPAAADDAGVTVQATGIEVDAGLIGRGLGLEPAQVPALMRAGKITSRCERGRDADAGRYRLTFFHGGRRLRLVIDEAGRVLQQAVVAFGDRPLPAALRRPGG